MTVEPDSSNISLSYKFPNAEQTITLSHALANQINVVDIARTSGAAENNLSSVGTHPDEM